MIVFRMEKVLLWWFVIWFHLFSIIICDVKLLIVQCDSTCSSESPFYNSTFIIYSGCLKKVLVPNDTIPSIKLDFNPDKDIMFLPSIVLENLSRGKDIPAIKRQSFSPDDVVLFEIQLTRALLDHEPLLLSKQLICEACKNPSIVKWNNQAFLVYESRLQQRKLNCYWINMTDYPIIYDHYLGVDNYIQLKDSQIMLQGADARLVAFNDDILYVAYEHPSMHMALATITKNNDKIQILSLQIWPDKYPNSPHKNWGPFIYNNALYLLQDRKSVV